MTGVARCRPCGGYGSLVDDAGERVQCVTCGGAGWLTREALGMDDLRGGTHDPSGHKLGEEDHGREARDSAGNGQRYGGAGSFVPAGIRALIERPASTWSQEDFAYWKGWIAAASFDQIRAYKAAVKHFAEDAARKRQRGC